MAALVGSDNGLATSHYLNQWWHNLLTHTCVTRTQWVIQSVALMLRLVKQPYISLIDKHLWYKYNKTQHNRVLISCNMDRNNIHHKVSCEIAFPFPNSTALPLKLRNILVISPPLGLWRVMKLPEQFTYWWRPKCSPLFCGYLLSIRRKCGIAESLGERVGRMWCACRHWNQNLLAIIRIITLLALQRSHEISLMIFLVIKDVMKSTMAKETSQKTCQHFLLIVWYL